MTARSFSVLRLLVEKKFAEKFDDVLASGVGRLSIIGDRDTPFDAGVVGSGELARIAVDDRALLLFLEAAFARSQRLRELHRAWNRLVVESNRELNSLNPQVKGFSCSTPRPTVVQNTVSNVGTDNKLPSGRTGSARWLKLCAAQTLHGILVSPHNTLDDASHIRIRLHLESQGRRIGAIEMVVDRRKVRCRANNWFTVDFTRPEPTKAPPPLPVAPVPEDGNES